MSMFVCCNGCNGDLVFSFYFLGTMFCFMFFYLNYFPFSVDYEVRKIFVS